MCDLLFLSGSVNGGFLKPRFGGILCCLASGEDFLVEGVERSGPPLMWRLGSLPFFLLLFPERSLVGRCIGPTVSLIFVVYFLEDFLHFLFQHFIFECLHFTCNFFDF